MKIRPIGFRDLPDSLTQMDHHPAKLPLLRSRFRRLFGGDQILQPPAPAEHLIEPTTFCLHRMVQNFIEDSYDIHAPSYICGCHPCNCFIRSDSDGSDSEHDATDACNFLKRLVMCASVSERNVLADVAKVLDMDGNRYKRKAELKNLVAEELAASGYDVGICKSKWEKTTFFPAGKYEYLDVILGETGERLIVDVDFRSEFEIARPTKGYKSAVRMLPNIFVGKPDRLSKIIILATDAGRKSLKNKGLHFPPWRKADYVQAKWLSAHTRTRIGVDSDYVHVKSEAEKSWVYLNDLPPLRGLSWEKGEEEEGSSSVDDQPLFAMSESSGEEDVKMKQRKDAKKKKWPMKLKSQEWC